MVWILLMVAVLAAFGFAYYWSATTERRAFKKRLRRLSPRKARRAQLHQFDQEEEARFMSKADREAGTLRGVRRITHLGLMGGAVGSAGGEFDGGGDGGDAGGGDL